MLNLTTATTAELVAFYNANVTTPVKKFSDRKTAERRCQVVVDTLNREEAAKAEKEAAAKAEKEAAAKAEQAATLAAAAPKKTPAADRDAVRAARYPSTVTTKAGATVTTKPANNAEIRATVSGATLVKTPAKPAATPSKLDAQRVTLTLKLANPKAGQRGFFATEFLPAVKAAADKDGIVVAGDVFAAFPAKTRAQLADCWAYLTQEGFAERI